MATTNRELTRATMPLGFLEPRLFGRRFTKEFDRFFNGEFPLTPVRDMFELGWVPEMEVFDKNGKLTVRLDVPGLEKEQLKVHVTEGMLTVEGERKHETEEEKNNWYRRERSYGTFYRTVPLPEGVNPKEVAATFRNGVLEVTVPLQAKAEPTPHKVEVRGPETPAPETKETVAA
jgi:HSP20 family protein